jgi:Ca2+-binding RTX toxin-like protein
VDGGPGTDTISSVLESLPVRIDPAAGTGDADGHPLTISQVENVLGGDDDLLLLLLGDDNDNTIHGAAGNDVIDGRGGEDRLYGEAGDDQLYALTGAATS